MASIYWVLSWACHRKCVHCYDERFRPYTRGELERVISQSESAWPRVIANLPADLSYCDAEGTRRPGRIILAGGEVLLNGFRERIFFPVLESIRSKWGKSGTARTFVQTTGDILSARDLDGMLSRGVWSIAISGFDDFHVGMTGAKREKLRGKIDALMARFGVKQATLGSPERDDHDGPYYLYFGATPGSWIGALWPRGRAWANGLSTASYELNFCAQHSGAKGFLNMREAGSEVAIEPNGNVYPCCLKTRAPLGNLTEEPLEGILQSLRGIDLFESLNRGDPAEMASHLGVSLAQFRDLSTTVSSRGKVYSNPCIGCDGLFEARVGAILRKVRDDRLTRRSSQQSTARSLDQATAGNT